MGKTFRKNRDYDFIYIKKSDRKKYLHNRDLVELQEDDLEESVLDNKSKKRGCKNAT